MWNPSDRQPGAFVLRALTTALAILACEHAPDPRLQSLIREHPAVTVLASAGLIAGADSVCAETFEPFWETYSVDFLVEEATPEKLAAAHHWLHRALAKMPPDARRAALTRIDGRVAGYVEVMTPSDYTVESRAIAIAMTPALVHLLPADIAWRADNAERVGWTLASAEHSELEHGLARYLGDMPPQERADVARNFRETVASVERQLLGSDEPEKSDPR